MKHQSDSHQRHVQAKNTEPASFQAQMGQAAAAHAVPGTLRTATDLKAEGNRLHAAGSYSAAAQKYEQARSSIQGGALNA